MPDPTRVPGLARLAPSIAFNSRVYCSARASSGASGAVISKTVPFRRCPPPPAMSGLAWRCSNAAAVRAVRLSPSCSAGTIKGSGWPPACGSGEDRRRHRGRGCEEEARSPICAQAPERRSDDGPYSRDGIELAGCHVCGHGGRSPGSRSLRNLCRRTATIEARYLTSVAASETLQARVERALAQLTNPRSGTDVVTAGMVKDLAVDPGGTVTLTFLLGSDDPGSLARAVRKAVQAVDGVTAVRVNLTDAGGGAAATASRQAAPRPGPGSVPPPPTPVDFPHLGRILAISSGKGGVGKSTVAANLAVALARAGHRVGLMDADIYGPNIPRMMGVDRKPEVRAGKIQPLEAHGVKLISLALIVERDAPAIWRGPIIMKVIQQFVRDVDWGELDYF